MTLTSCSLSITVFQGEDEEYHLPRHEGREASEKEEGKKKQNWVGLQGDKNADFEGCQQAQVQRSGHNMASAAETQTLLGSHGSPRVPVESATFTVDLGQQLAQGPLHLPGAADKAGHDPQQFILVLLPDHGDGLQDELHLLQLVSPWKAEPDSEVSPGPVCCKSHSGYRRLGTGWGVSLAKSHAWRFQELGLGVDSTTHSL